MKALVFHGAGKKSWEDVPHPAIQEPTDVIAKVDTTTICGTDLHILRGHVPAVSDGRVLGHEAVGTVTEVGGAVTDLAVGDRIIIPAVTSCGKCSYCKQSMPSHCQTLGGIGWVFGHLIDGTQAEFVRVPYAETSVHKVPPGLDDEDVLFLTDALPTGFEVGILNGRTQPGDSVAVIGVGPVGLGAIMTAGLCGAGQVIAVDMDENRMDKALELGATHKVDASRPDAAARIKALTPDGLGVDVAIEAVGIPASFQTCIDVIRPGGTIANVGVHGAPVQLPLQDLWISNIAITTGLVDCRTVGNLLNMVRSRRLNARAMATHHFALSEIGKAYEVFDAAARNRVIKVVLRAD
jgi:alcohol dehydrogenase